MRRSNVMLLAYFSVGLAILSNLLYHISQKLTPPGANPALALTVTYLVALGVSVTVLWVFFPLQTGLRQALQQLNWASVALGVAIVGIEFGFLLGYRAGWKISLLQIVVSAAVTLLVIPVGLVAFKQAQAKIKELTGIQRSENQVRTFLKALGVRCRKVGMIPAKADPDEQAAYLNDRLEPRLAEAQAGQRAVFFVDAAHFVLAPFLGFLWSFVRVFIKAPAGRQRFNVLGALNAVTHQLVTVTHTTSINAESVCELLRQLAALNLEIPITLFLDNSTVVF